MKSVRCASNRRVRATLAAIGLCFAVVSTPAAAPAAPVAVGACETTGTKVKVSQTFQETTSTAFVNVIDTSIAFTQRSTGCVIVSFSAAAYADETVTMFVAALVDGYGCAPYDSRFLTGLRTYTSLAMNFVCRDVAPGGHIVKMVFRGNATGSGVVALRDRTMIVHYAR